MARAVVRLFRLWQVDSRTACMILTLDPSRWADWQQDRFGELDDTLATRLAILVRIHARLRIMFTDRNRGYAWMRRPNAVFEGRAPISVLAEGDLPSLLRVKNYLDAEIDG